MAEVRIFKFYTQVGL